MSEAIGVLGWNEQEALTADINSIELGSKRKWEMLKICHGLEQKEQKAKPSAKEIKDFAQKHNSMRSNNGDNSR